MNIIRKFLKKESKFFGVLKKSMPLNFYALQLIGFLYYIYWFLSKNFTIYGFFHCTEGIHNEFIFDGWIVPLFYLTSFQFIYEFIPYITPQIIEFLQWIVVISSILGLMGIYPKCSAILCFIITYHLVGIELICNANLDGAVVLALCLMLVLSISSNESFYSFKNGLSLNKLSVHYHWPVFIFYLLVCEYYTTAGINKIIDIGFNWPFLVHMDRYALESTEHSLFLSNYYSNPIVLSLFFPEWISISGSILTFFAEIFFFTILIFPRYRFFFIFTMIIFHIIVFFTLGLNYTCNIVMLLLCLDFNSIFNSLKRT